MDRQRISMFFTPRGPGAPEPAGLRAGGSRASARALGAVLLRRLPGLPTFVAFVAAAALIVRTNVYFMQPRAAVLFGRDEGYAMALGWRLLSGQHLPYVDGVSHRGPVYYWSVAAALKIFGTGTWMPVRVLALTCMLLTIALGGLAARAAGRSFAGAIFALSCTAVWLGDLRVADGLGYNSELPLNVFALAALLGVTRALRSANEPHRELLLGLAGAATMLSALSKQVGLVLVVPLGFWVVAFALRSGRFRERESWKPVLAYGAGALLPLAAIVLRYAAAGELGNFYYYLIRYNTEVYGGALQGEARLQAIRDTFLGHYELWLGAAPLLGWAASRLLVGEGSSVAARLGRYATRGFDSTVIVGFAVTLLASNASLRDFPHYYLQVIPWAGLLAGLLVEWSALGIAGGSEPGPWRVLFTRSLVLGPLVVVAALGSKYRLEEYPKDAALNAQFSTETWPICDFLRHHTKPTDSIFIWGFDPVPYTACNRRPASRYVFTTFVAGYVPWIDAPREVEDARAAPHSRELLIEDLERDKPAAIFDSPESMAGRSLLQYPFLKAYVERHFCRANVALGPVTWLRMKHGRCPE